MLLEMRNIYKRFGAVRALQNVSLKVGHSEIHGLIGENGAGKSTLMNILAGVIKPTKGEIVIDGNSSESMNTNKAKHMGIRFIHQELNVVNDLRVYENLFLGEELLTKHRLLDKKEMIKRSRDVFKKMEIDINPMDMVSWLDTSQKQLVEIAKALLFESKLIIMDEPTTALTNKEIESLFIIMRNLKTEGVSFIYISHKMPEIFEICEKYTVLRDGKLIDSGNIADINEEKATELLVGRSIRQSEIKLPKPVDKIAISIEGLQCERYFSDVTFDIKQGEVVAITGLQGDGKSELAETLFGIRKTTHGSIRVKNKEITNQSIKGFMKHRIAMIQRNRKERSILKDLSISDNLSIGYFNLNHKKTIISDKEELDRYEKNKELIGIKANNPKDLITSLSGGNQQKVIIGRWLELDADIYILDNPTQGIDVGAKFEIYKLIRELANKGKAIILFSTEYPEIYQVAHRCLVMYKGRINAELSRDDFSEVNVMYYATGSNLEGLTC